MERLIDIAEKGHYRQFKYVIPQTCSIHPSLQPLNPHDTHTPTAPTVIKISDRQRERRNNNVDFLILPHLLLLFPLLFLPYFPQTKQPLFPPAQVPLPLAPVRSPFSRLPRLRRPPAELETMDLKKYVKSRLPGGFAAQTIIGTGRRKCAIARVVLQEGTGKVIINYRDAKEYLQGNPLWLQYVKVPLVTLGYESSYDVFVKAHGGGLSGQAQAISLGIARALLRVSEDHRRPLRKEGLLTRDSRIVERKKVGLKKARKAPQFSKR
ncbi:hypothetical protein I3842_03G171800 [Carya illinoinensis]|uniref:Small ribosomal subunit protein uS9c n=1 Tax=Carya illinoinensis TaxID=32201 RepID=A0A922FM60_CARIL|nr:hypothetical protein I3842_03G171800 [Carya illinoinensis]